MLIFWSRYLNIQYLIFKFNKNYSIQFLSNVQFDFCPVKLSFYLSNSLCVCLFMYLKYWNSHVILLH